jgi:hypothetical protein
MNIDKNSNTLIPHNLLTKFTINNIVFNLHKYNNIDFSSNKSSVLSINNTSSISISNNDYFNDTKINYNEENNEDIYNENIYKDITDIFDKIELKDIEIKKSDIEILNNNFNIVLKELENFGLNNSLKISNLISENQKLHEEIIILNKKINFLYNHLNLNNNENNNQNINNKENIENNKSSWYFWRN